MAEENASTMNLDLNLGPLDNSSGGVEPGSGSNSNVGMSLDELLNGRLHRVRHVVRGERWRSLLRQLPIPPESRNLALELLGGVVPQTGLGSLVIDEAPDILSKTCENSNRYEKDCGVGSKDNSGKNKGEESTYFDCNICLDLAKEPVVTCCGHLFCWPCLYKWLHHHSDAKECPICKGEVNTKNVTPIYGRGSNNTRGPNAGRRLKIPLRPQARRVESWRQTIQRAALPVSVEEMVRRLGGTFDLSMELAQLQSQNPDNHEESPERRNLLLSRILTARGIRREHSPEVLSSLDLTEGYEVTDDQRPMSNLTSAINSTERPAEGLVVSYFDRNPVERSEELPLLPFDDMDSLFSIAAAIPSASPTVDNAVEIDSTVALSTFSGRQDGASRTWDVDGGDSRAPMRRRLS